jgi:hypothetical protein
MSGRAVLSMRYVPDAIDIIEMHELPCGEHFSWPISHVAGTVDERVEPGPLVLSSQYRWQLRWMIWKERGARSCGGQPSAPWQMLESIPQRV